MVAARHRQAGFSYWFVLLALCMTGLAALRIGTAWQQQVRRESEEQLLFIGEQYRRAIASYYASTPGLAKLYPRELQDLLVDNRYPEPRHHLRRLYGDPVAAGKPFELIRGTQGELLGVFSGSLALPLKTSGFGTLQEGFDKAKHYSDWKFFFIPPGASPAVVLPGPVLPAAH